MFNDFFNKSKKVIKSHEIVEDINILIKHLREFEDTWERRKIFHDDVIEAIQIRFDFVGVKIHNRIDEMEEMGELTCDLDRNGAIVMNLFGKGSRTFKDVWFKIRWRIGDINTKVGFELIKDPARLFPDD